MTTVANTDQVGRLIRLCGNAIELAPKRNREQLEELLGALQIFKDPNARPTEATCNCGKKYPPRPKIRPRQVICPCQLRPGVKVIFHYDHARSQSAPITITSYPYPKLDGYLRVNTNEYGHSSGYYLVDCAVEPTKRGTWHESNWLELVESVEHHCCHTCNHCM